MDDIIERRENPNTKRAEAKFCPMIKQTCIQDKCMWWVADWMEDKNAYQYHCAISMIAEALNNENLMTYKSKKDLY